MERQRRRQDIGCQGRRGRADQFSVSSENTIPEPDSIKAESPKLSAKRVLAGALSASVFFGFMGYMAIEDNNRESAGMLQGCSGEQLVPADDTANPAQGKVIMSLVTGLDSIKDLNAMPVKEPGSTEWTSYGSSLPKGVDEGSIIPLECGNN